ncbi:MAG: TolC family protein [Candidatus Aminicenantes bacterium]|nr:TolC family protein [Candidatus Aminicenantes bacterium]
MKRIKIIYLFSILFLITGVLGQQKEKALSLEDCIVGALKNNLGVAVEVLKPELADISVSLAREKFLPSISFGYNTQNTSSPSFSWIDAAGQVETQFNDYSAQISQLIPTGGTFAASIYSYKNDTNRKFQTINPRYGSNLSFSFSQPLLKNFGFKVTGKEIILARNNMEISENQLKIILLDTIYNVEEVYWNLVYSIENLKVKKQSLRLAQDLLTKNRREVEVGTLAPIEILSAQSEVATREADILQAEVLVRNNEDSLMTIINLAAEEKVDLVKIIPTEKPSYEEREISLEDALLTGMENRPDLQATRIDIKNKDLDLSVAKNQLLPDLSFQAAYWSPGISGSQLLYLDNNPLSGEIVGIIPGGASNALKDAFNFKYRNWSVGLTFSIPINTIFSRAQFAQAKISLEQTILGLKNKEQQAFLEIRNAVRAVQTNYKRVNAYKVARELAEEKLEAEEKKLKVGLTTNYLVLQHQRDLGDARGAELRAIVDYNLSLAALDKALGISLNKKNIKFSEINLKIR